ncbi:hypothetical protein [Cetobacterium sp.]|uniref:hypothetical protein n=1 Tax=Cetobacterium sp. TaxID=2071632 RepID=UPI003F331111
MSIILTKNSLTDVNVFFYKSDFTNVHRPLISFLKIDDATKIEPVFHIGIDKAMGFLSSFNIVAGIMVFEVLEGTPLQELMFIENNNSTANSYRFSITELPPMDLYVIQKNNQDPYGDFILTDLKFTSTKMEQNIEVPGRQLIAEFICTSKKAFRIPYFYNNFKSDNYRNHFIRNKDEIYQIYQDIKMVEDIIPSHVLNELNYTLNLNKTSTYDVFTTLYDEFIKEYKSNLKNLSINQMITSKRLANAIFIFYEWKNKYEEARVHKDSRLKFLEFQDGGTNV